MPPSDIKKTRVIAEMGNNELESQKILRNNSALKIKSIKFMKKLVKD